MDMTTVSAAMRNGEAIDSRTRLRLVFTLSVPAILEQLAATVMGYIDTAMVGALGPDATAAIGVVSSTIWLFNGIINAAALGFYVQVAQYLGAGSEEDSRSVLTQAILFNGVFGAALALIAVLLGRSLPGLLGADAAIQADASAYFCTLGAFFPFQLAMILYAGILRCGGSARLPSLIHVGMCGLDIILNFFLIYPTRQLYGVTVWGAGLGVRGAALGTGLSMLCAGVLLLYLTAWRRGSLCLRGRARWRFQGPYLRNMVRLATPAALERATLCTAQILMTGVVAAMGTTSVAANYIAVQVEGICYLPAYGIAAAATALVGQSIGAGRRDMAKWFADCTTAVSFGLVAVTGTFLFIAAPWLSGTMTKDPAVLALSTQVLRIVVFCEPMFAVSISVTGALRGAGDTRGPFLLNLFSMWGVRVVAVLLVGRQYGLVGVWTTMSCELVFRCILFLHRLKKGRWLDTASLVK